MVPRSGELTVIGEGTSTAALDVVTLSVGVLTTGPSATQVLRESAARMLGIVQALIAVGVNQKDTHATGMSIVPQTAQHGAGDGAPVVAYHATASLNITLHDAHRISEILDAAIRAGANANIGVAMRLKDELAVQRTALEAAVRNAREKAETLAAATGKRLGDALALAEEPGTPLFGGGMANFSIMPVLPGDVSVSARVRVTWDFL
jgi:uncharacterized protein YggE